MALLATSASVIAHTSRYTKAMLFIEIDTKHGVHIVFERVVGYEYRQDGAKPVLVVHVQGDKEFRTADSEGITNFLQYVQKHNKAKHD